MKALFYTDHETLIYRDEIDASTKELGDLTWLDYRPLKDGAAAFKEIHDGTTESPKIILLP